MAHAERATSQVALLEFLETIIDDTVPKLGTSMPALLLQPSTKESVLPSTSEPTQQRPQILKEVPIFTLIHNPTLLPSFKPQSPTYIPSASASSNRPSTIFTTSSRSAAASNVLLNFVSIVAVVVLSAVMVFIVLCIVQKRKKRHADCCECCLYISSKYCFLLPRLSFQLCASRYLSCLSSKSVTDPISSGGTRLRSELMSWQPGSESMLLTIPSQLQPKSILSSESSGVPALNWEEFSTYSGNSIESRSQRASMVLGHGSFGTVIRAVWTPLHSRRCSIHGQKVDVAVKILTRSFMPTSSDHGAASFECKRRRAHKEAAVMMLVGSQNQSDCFVMSYGVVAGELPANFSELLHVPMGEPSIGIVMRYEGGGSLAARIHSGSTAMTMCDRLQLLVGTARGISCLHASGIIHGDIKPENVLLSNHNPPHVRLADFGMSSMHSEIQVDSTGSYGEMHSSSVYLTTHTRGTPIYCAPEMLVDPYKAVVDCTVSRASRKTDVYAFALLMWEVLTGQRPFAAVRTEAALCVSVHQGLRPDIGLLPVETPQKLKDLIVDCWNKSRSVRRSSAECLVVLMDAYQMLRDSKPLPPGNFLEASVQFCQSNASDISTIAAIVGVFANAGVTVRYSRYLGDCAHIQRNPPQLFVACVDRNFQEDKECIEALHIALERAETGTTGEIHFAATVVSHTPAPTPILTPISVNALILFLDAVGEVPQGAPSNVISLFEGRKPASSSQVTVIDLSDTCNGLLTISTTDLNEDEPCALSKYASTMAQLQTKLLPIVNFLISSSH